MDKQIQLDIVTPHENMYSDKIDMVILRTTEGDLGILYDHEPTVAPLSVGPIKIRKGNDYFVAACAGGFVNIETDKVTVVTDAAEWASQIDLERAESAKARAEKRLAIDDDDVNLIRARLSYKRASNRIHVAQTYKDK